MAMKAAAVLVVLVAVRAVYGADIIVGGNSGWNQGVNYDTWAAGQTFRVGDTLGNFSTFYNTSLILLTNTIMI